MLWPRSGAAFASVFPPVWTMRPRPQKSMAGRPTGGPGNQVEVLDLVPRRDRDALRPEPLDLLAADGPRLGRADDPVRGYDPEPGQSFGLLGGERREDEGDLAGRDLQVPSDGPVSGDAAFGDGGHDRQDLRPEPHHST